MRKFSAANKNICVIGGSGFVSGAFVKQALSEGHNVWTITRGKRQLHPQVQSIIADRHNRQMFKETVQAQEIVWDMVVDCIGYDEADITQDIEVFKNRTKHLVFISTDFVYDPFRRKFPQPENSEHYNSDGYGGEKRRCEVRLIQDWGSLDLDWTILRPCHIYGPGSELGCFPLAGRDPNLIDKLIRGEKIQLIGGGYFLQQPIYVYDLCEIILKCLDNPKSHNQIFNIAGPDVVESREYYQIIARCLNVELNIEEIPVSHYESQPDYMNFLCHRIYDLSKLKESGFEMPVTHLEQGLKKHIEFILGKN